jgi:aminoglycoside phosphotransferase (APT) family kinase protein
MVRHGDFHPDNNMLIRRGPGVIDWMTAGSGVPAAAVPMIVCRVSPFGVKQT